MLTKAEEKRIKSLHKKKGRREHRRCLVEGVKLIESARDYVETTFSPKDSLKFDKLVTTESPQEVAAVARIPEKNLEDIELADVVVILDHVQDPGNVGTILRSCLGFQGSLILIESADPTSAKVIRSSAGAMFHVPWIELSEDEASTWLEKTKRTIYRLERRDDSIDYQKMDQGPIVIIAGSEGSGITLKSDAPSVMINHSERLESLNVAQAVTIVLASHAVHTS